MNLKKLKKKKKKNDELANLALKRKQNMQIFK